MISKSFLFLLGICLSNMLNVFSGEIKVSQYKIKYDTPKNKYFARLLSKQLPKIHKELYKLTGLKCHEHISIYLHNELNFIKKYKISGTNFSSFDTAISINIILSQNRLKNAIHPFLLLTKKKILFALFRQNKIPENFWFEESFFEVLLYEEFHLGAISIPILNTGAHFRFLREDIKTWNDWDKKASKIQITSINDSLQKVSNTKFLILNDWYNYKNKRDSTLNSWVKKKIDKLRKKKLWQLILSENFKEEEFKKLSKKRKIYSKIMQNFNYPKSNRIEDSSKYIFKYALRMLLKNERKLCESLFREINFYPVSSSYFAELGLYLTKNNKENNGIWLEYYLINQNNKTPINFNNITEVNKMISETINVKNREFTLKDKDLELFRAIQFSLFSGNINLLNQLKNKIIKSKKRHLELLNLYWSVGLLLNDKKSRLHFRQYAQLYNASIWPCLKPYFGK
ncbi:MAG: hypothetical protein COA79_03250 [Planctomycetota bacterium]|nr:MAG: hypothetical protein COA79_03250 [Planctomycetota bacterium]